MDQSSAVRKQLTQLLEGGESFRPYHELLEGITLEIAGQKHAHLPYTIWQLLEHIRFTQADILNFSRNATYNEPKWPDDYWPATEAPANEHQLIQSIAATKSDLKEMIALIQDTHNDLYKAFEHGDGQTLLREALVLSQHNAYHFGELVVLRRLLGNWNI